mgnify:CR=1 FL=1
MEAELVSHLEDTVEIQRGTKQFSVPISMFAEADQKFIRSWITANPGKVGYKFNYYIDLDQARVENRSVDGAAYDDRLKTMPQDYDVIVYNKTKSDYSDIDIRFEIYVNDQVETKGNRYAALASGTKKTDKVQTIPGKVTGVSIPAEGRVEFIPRFDIHSYVDRDGGRVDQAAKDSVIGIRIRIYKGDQLLHEYIDSEDSSRMKHANWSGTKASKATPLK